MKVTLEEAEQLILEKRAKEAERHIKKFDEEPELEILNGRYGPYIAYKGNNYKIPKDIVPQDLSLKSCLDLIKIQDEKGPSTSAKGKRTATKKYYLHPMRHQSPVTYINWLPDFCCIYHAIYFFLNDLFPNSLF